MANPEHLSIFKKGREAWNLWREEHPEIHPDLSGLSAPEADLDGFHFEACDLSRSDLRKCRLRQCCFRESDLFQAYLSETDLSGSDFEAAVLRQADLRNAQGLDVNFRKAGLNSARLEEAVLEESNFYGADLSQVSAFRSNLSRSNFSDADLSKVDFREIDAEDCQFLNADLFKADLSGSELSRCDFSGASLFETQLGQCTLKEAVFANAKMAGAYLYRANLKDALLTFADLSSSCLVEASLDGADLREAILVEANLEKAILANCLIHGVSTWKAKYDGSMQRNLIISRYDEPVIKVDQLEIAQFIYLLLYNPAIKSVLDKLTTRIVLVLGDFDGRGEDISDAIREALQKRELMPVFLHFREYSGAYAHETVDALADLARYVIADVSGVESIPAELAATIESRRHLLVQPLLQSGQELWRMYDFIAKYSWVRPLIRFKREEFPALIDKEILPALEAAIR